MARELLGALSPKVVTALFSTDLGGTVTERDSPAVDFAEVVPPAASLSVPLRETVNSIKCNFI